MAKTIVITGAGDGLGRALARRFAKDGDTVILLGRTLSKVEAVAEELGGTAMPVLCDVADADSVRKAFAEIKEKHDKIDVLINNAGVYEPFSLTKNRDDQILTPLMINVAGPIFCAREAVSMMDAGGHIINVSSESVDLKFPMLWMYAGSKAALERISKSWEEELAPQGIRVTTVRAGQMMDETKGVPTWDPEDAMAFHQACQAKGINLMERPISHFNSVPDAFRAVIDMPADIHVPHIDLCARKAQ